MPDEALSGLSWLYHTVEQNLDWPEGVKYINMALLPKNQDAERPISLTSYIYRLYMKLRGHLVDAWVQQISPCSPWDAAIPGGQIFESLLTRMLKGELAIQTGSYHVCLLLDLNNFFESIDRDLLMEEALELGYPPLLLLLSMIVHSSSRVLLAEGQASTPIYPRISILQGCPSSVALAKAYLYRPLHALKEAFPEADISNWLDDLAFDHGGHDMEPLVETMTLLFLQIQRALRRLNLSINMKKSGFLCSHACVRTALRQYQRQHFPSHGFPKSLDCIRDLGIDNTAGRLRRLPTSKSRITRSLRRAARLSQTPRRLRKTLVQNKILASGLWGMQGMGLAPTTLRMYRARIGRSGGFVRKLGCLTTGWRLFCSRAVDPVHKTPMQQVAGFFDVFHILSPKWKQQTRKVWRISYHLIVNKLRYWHYACGPLNSFMCRLKDLKWHTPDLQTWYDSHGAAHAVDIDRPLALSQLGYLLEQSQEEQLWLHVSRHIGRKDLEQGADLTVAIKHL